MSNGEVAHANRACLTLLLQSFQGAPALPSLRHRIVDQVQIYVIQVEPAQTRFESTLRACVIAVPQFRGYENLLPANAARPDGGAHALLVAVKRCSVDMAIARFESGEHGRFALPAGGDLPHPQAELGDRSIVIQIYL